jgi:hypothetical protein
MIHARDSRQVRRVRAQVVPGLFHANRAVNAGMTLVAVLCLLLLLVFCVLVTSLLAATALVIATTGRGQPARAPAVPWCRS